MVKTGPNPNEPPDVSELCATKLAVRPGCPGSDAVIRTSPEDPFARSKVVSGISTCCVVILCPPWRFPAQLVVFDSASVFRVSGAVRD